MANAEASPFVLGIAGATGSGKSTLAYGLQDMAPDKVAVLHLDDYFIHEEQMPELAGYRNWDDPASIRHEEFAKDLSSLVAGHSITVDTKSVRLNPDYYKTYQYKTVEIEPKPLIIVDGFLLLHYPELRELLDKSVYLDAPFDVHNNRRVHPAEQNYRFNVIKPMVEKYLLPSSAYADLVIDVEKNTQEQVLDQVANILPPEMLSN